MEHVSNITPRVLAAAEFAAYHAKHQGLLREDFDRWATRYRLPSAEYLRLWRLVHAEAVARGELVYTRIDGEAA